MSNSKTDLFSLGVKLNKIYIPIVSAVPVVVMEMVKLFFFNIFSLKDYNHLFKFNLSVKMILSNIIFCTKIF